MNRLLLFLAVLIIGMSTACIPVRESGDIRYVGKSDYLMLSQEVDDLKFDIEECRLAIDTLDSAFTYGEAVNDSAIQVLEEQIDSLQNLLVHCEQRISDSRDSIEYQKIVTDSIAQLLSELDRKLSHVSKNRDKLQLSLDSCRRVLREGIDNIVTGHVFRTEPGSVDYFLSKGVRINYVVVGENQLVRMHLEDRNGRLLRSLGSLQSQLSNEGQEIICLMNGGMFNRQGRPQGLYIEEGNELNDLDTTEMSESGPNFVLGTSEFPNGIFLVHENGYEIIRSDDWSKYPDRDNVLFATQSGPMLTYDSIRNPTFRDGSRNKHIRNGVGVTSDGIVILAISEEPINLWDFSDFFLKHGCPSSLYLDGAISKAYVPELDIVNLGGNLGPLISVVKK